MKRDDTELMLKLSVSLSDGSFDTAVQLPVEASQNAREAVVKAWFGLIQEALKCYGERAGREVSNGRESD